MASPLTVYKLIVLYLLDRAGGSLAKPRLSEFLIENGYVNFVNLLQTYAQIEERGLVRASGDGEDILELTDEGKDTLRFFASDLSASIREQADAWLKKNGMKLRSDRDTTAEYYRTTGGDYEVRLAVKEKEATIVGVTLSVPDRDTAKHIVDGWKEKNREIYSFLVEKLF